ncbi:aldose 1-epimerase [Curvibacter sp. CHRR-16]|uniref:aldose 1-epimerase n=1 Tax=Curvibacter sp. CHRR-16 TaxID=2835872 RepID=UPI001BDA15EC|nr:aldose 1-epimerase [Curvibacter sp. CHRR-16]MBT0570108.1 aldose 1-epimerase [Curvibacter sp. CHRR-16]
MATSPDSAQSCLSHPIVWLSNAQQRLGLVPTLGAGMAAWRCYVGGQWVDLLRRWDGQTTDMYTLASFAMLPWSNRISQGGFDVGPQHYPMQCNRVGEPYPIHGDGWLQAWQCEQPEPHVVEMRLHSRGFQGNPYHYEALQRFVLHEEGLEQVLHVTHLGAQPLPYGLGQHPWFARDPDTVLHTPVQGVWLSGADPIPTAHRTDFPPELSDWNPTQGMPAYGTFIDNGFTGWNGVAHIDWPSKGLRLHLRHTETAQRPQADGYCLVYRPSTGPAFCFEPITHPIDAFHMPGQPGLALLQQGQSVGMHLHWRIERRAQEC